jgi:hypothetical protein
MRQYSLDTIVKTYLSKRGLSIHYYVEALSHACDCLRELNFDTMKVVKTVKLPVNSYGATTLPTDYVDFVKIGFPRGQYVVEMSQSDGLNRLNNFDDQGNKIKYEAIDTDYPLSSWGWDGATYIWASNDRGELLGRGFNIQAGTTHNSFKILRERGEIQMDNRFAADYIVLEYIGDGLDTNAETSVHPYAQSTIESYISWKSSPSRDALQSNESLLFHNNLRILRARMNDTTILDFLRAKQKGYKATVRN